MHRLGEIFLKHIFEKGLACRVQKYFFQQQENKQSSKMGRDLHRHFTRKDKWVNGSSFIAAHEKNAENH